MLEWRVAGQGVDADSRAVEAVVEMAAGRSRGGGQGFLVSQAVRKAVESYAVARAIRHFRSQGWTVKDVGSTESYDLDCTRGLERLHVEVKGTTTIGERIILTPNEVAHARAWHPNVGLFVVSKVELAESDPDHPVPRGGTARVWPEWMPYDERLEPVGYFYGTDVADEAQPAGWLTVPWISESPTNVGDPAEGGQS